MSGFGRNAVKACRSLVLLLTGGLMVSMALSGDLWQYLNPSFSPLISAAGGMLLILGVLLPFAPLGRRPAGELVPAAVFGAFLFLAGWSLDRPLVAAEPEWSGPGTELYYGAPKNQGAPRQTWQGREYVKLNTSELLSLADQGAAPEWVAVQGMVLKAEGPDGRERTVLVRAQIVCCLADALGVGFQLSGPGLEGIEPGQWVRVLGGLDPIRPDLTTGQVAWPGVVLVVLDSGHVLAAENVEVVDPPELPYIFDVRTSEPFAY